MIMLRILSILASLGCFQAFSSNLLDGDDVEVVQITPPSLKGKYQLVNDSLLQIFLNCSLKELASLSEVNRDFYQLINKTSFKEDNSHYLARQYPLAKGKTLKFLISEEAKLQMLLCLLKQDCEPEKFHILRRLTTNHFVQLDPYFRKIYLRVMSLNPPRDNDPIIEALYTLKLNMGVEYKIKQFQGKNRTRYSFIKNYVNRWKDLELAYEFKLLPDQERYQLNEHLAKTGLEKALERKIEGLSSGTNGYVQDAEAARDFIENLINEDNEIGVRFKLKGLQDGLYGYDLNMDLYNQFYEKVFSQFRYPILIELQLSAMALSGRLKEVKQEIRNQNFFYILSLVAL